MIEMSVKSLMQIRDEEIDTLLPDITGIEFSSRTLEPLQNVLDYLTRARSKVLMPSVSHIAIREATLHVLLDAFLRQQGDFQTTAKKAGESVGISFARDMMSFLVQSGRIPRDEYTVVKIWAWFDTNASWGNFEVSLDKGEKFAVITVDDSFLVRGLKGNIHRFCPFMEGYVFGVLWESLKIWHRLFSVEFGLIERPCLEPREIKEEKIDSTCKFTVQLQYEELIDSFDLIHSSREYYQSGNFRQVALNLRNALELGFKKKIDLSKNDKTSLIKLIRAFKDNNIKLPYRSIKDAYDLTSKTAAHYGEDITNEKTLKLLDDIEPAINSLERLQITQEQKDAIRKRIDEIKESKDIDESYDAR